MSLSLIAAAVLAVLLPMIPGAEVGTASAAATATPQSETRDDKAPDDPPAGETGADDQASQSGQPSQSEQTVWYDEIVVTATRGESSAGRIPLFSTVVDSDAVATSPDSGVIDLVRQTPSINFRVNTNNLVAQPRDQGITMRGLGGATQSRALALIDGLPMIDAYGGFVIWSQVPKEFVDRIEVVRGGGSGVWGNLALTGVVNLITRPVSDRQFRADLRAGNKSTQLVSASYSDNGAAWSGWIGVNYLDTDGFQDVAADERTPIDEPSNRQYESLTGKLAHTFSPSTSLSLRGVYYDEDREEGTPLDRGRTEERWLAGTLDSVREGGASWEVRLFGHSTLGQEFNGTTPDLEEPQSPLSNIFDVSSDAFGLSALWYSAGRGKHSLTSGADFQYTSIERREDLDWDGTQFTTNYFVAGRQQLAGLFIEDNFAPSDRLSLLLSGRVDRIKTYDGESLRVDKLSGDVLRKDLLDDNSETSFNPFVGFVYAASSSSRIRGAAYTGFRGAMPSELFVGNVARRTVTQPNPELSPESLRGLEAGYDFTPSSQLWARFTVFWNEIDDLVQRVTTGTAPSGGGEVFPCGFVGSGLRCSQRRNIGQARSTGIEVETTYQPTPAWRLFLSAILLDAEVTENPIDPELVGNRLSRAPEDQAALSVSYNNRRLFSALVRARYVGDAYDDVENEEYMPSYYLIDLSLGRGLGPRWELFAGVENLLDKTYIVSIASAGTLIGAPRLYHLGLRFSG